MNLRYHIFTISAIFAALGIGILIGTCIIGDEGLLEEQQRIIRDISNDINRLKEENSRLLKNLNTLEADLNYKKNIEQKLYPLLLKDLMEGRSFFLLYNNVSEEKLDEFAYYLKLMNVDYDFYKYKKEDWPGQAPDISCFSHLITWNLKEDLYVNALLNEKQDFSLLNFQGDDAQDLIINIIKEVLNDK